MRFDTKFEQHIRSLEKAARRRTVRIANPLPGGKTRLKYDVALRHCEAGAADWNADRTAIRFNPEAVRRAIQSMKKQRQAARVDALIRNGIAAFHSIKGLPCPKPMDLLGPVRKKYFGSKRAVWKTRRNSTPPVQGPQEKPQR